MRGLTAAVLCWSTVAVSGAGSATLVEIIRDQAEADATTYDIPPGDCVVLYLKGEKVKGGSSLRKLMDPPVWPGSELIGQEWPYEKSDGTRGCFRDPLATDAKGAQCLNCMLVNSVLTEDSYCSESETRQFWEYYNDTPNPISFKIWGAKFENAPKQTTDGFKCIPLLGPVDNTCKQTDLPDCNWKGDSETGGIMKGSPLHASVPCECSCIGGFTSEANGCQTPPSCDMLDLTGSPNVNPSYHNLLFNNDSFGLVSKDSNLNQSMFDGASDFGTGTVLMGPVCAPGYQLDISVTLDCPKKDDTATASGDVCIVANDDCANAPCGMGQDCVDMDMSMDGNFVCNCQAPAMGTNANGPVASCGADTDCTDPANVCVTAGQDCIDNDMMKDTNFECACKPPNAATTAMNAAATCPTADDCNGMDACTAAGQDCVDMDMMADGNYICKCPPPNDATTAMNAAAMCPADDCTGGMDVCTMAGQDCIDMDGMQDGNLLCRCKAPDTGEATNAAATCTMMTADDCATSPCGATQDCVDSDMTANMVFTCNCKPPGVGTAMGAPAMCEDDCTVSLCGADQSCTDTDGLKNSAFRCDCNPPLLGSNVNATAVCTGSGSQDDCSTVPAVCGTGQTCSDPDMTADNMFTCTCDPPNTGTNNGAAAVCSPPVNNDCASTPCASGQTCVDNDNTINNAFKCNCDAPTTGSGLNGPAVCATPPPTIAPKEEDDDKFLMGLIIGLSVAIICLIGCLYMFWRWRVAKKEAKNARMNMAVLPMEESRSTPLLPPPEPVKEEPPVVVEEPPVPPPPPKPKEIVDESESDYSSSESAILTPPDEPLVSGKELVADEGGEDLSSLETPPSPPSSSRVNLRFNTGSSAKPVMTSIKSASPNASTTWAAST